MIGKLYIDGIDAYAAYDAFVTNGGYADLVEFSPLKEIKSNDWPEHDGIEPDLSEPVLAAKPITISFVTHNRARTSLLLQALSDDSYHEFDFREIGRTYRLRLTNNPSFVTFEGMEIFQLAFSRDFPVSDSYVYSPPLYTNSGLSEYSLDGRDLAEYGIRVLKGSLSEVLKMPTTKEHLIIDLKKEEGLTYDDQDVIFKQKDVRLLLLMKASNLNDFWHNYDAFLHDLTQPGQRELFVDYTGYQYPCFYKNCNSVEFMPTGGNVWYKFNLTLTFITFRRAGEESETLLATERGFLLCTEESGDVDPIYIDLSTY